MDEVNNLFTEKLHLCPICSSQHISGFSNLTHFHVSLAYSVCHSCGIVFQNPRIPEEKLSDFYASKYRLLYLGQVAPRAIELEVQKKRATHLVNFLVANNVVPHSHLDIGSGSGALLVASKKHFQNITYGIEFDKEHRLFASHNGIDMYDSLEGWQNTLRRKVDLVSLSHVLEHVAHPVSYLVNIRDTILNNKGALLLEVPNLYFHPSLEIAHMFAFSFTSLKNVLSLAGFSIIASKLHSVPRSMLSPLYITVLARPTSTSDKRPISEKQVRIKRTVGFATSNLERLVRRYARYARIKLHRLLAQS